MAKLNENDLKRKFNNEDSKTLCLYYDTILKIRESYAKYRQLNPQNVYYKDKYDELYYVENVIREIITERFIND